MAEHISEEETRELQEKLKNMSPEELKEFQKKQCIFCHIINGKIPSKKIYEDDLAIAILDISPAHSGHVLILPKEHYAIMPQLPADVLSHLFSLVKLLSNAALRSLEVQGTNVLVANGAAAGQKAQHFMIHLIPRTEDDGLLFDIPQRSHSDEELSKLAGALAGAIGKSSTKNKPMLDADFSETKRYPGSTSTPVGLQSTEPDDETDQPISKPSHIQQKNQAKPVPTPTPKPVPKPAKKNEQPHSKNATKSVAKPAAKPAAGSANLDDIARMLGVK